MGIWLSEVKEVTLAALLEILEALKAFYGQESAREFEEVSKIGGNFPVFYLSGPSRVSDKEAGKTSVRKNYG